MFVPYRQEDVNGGKLTVKMVDFWCRFFHGLVPIFFTVYADFSRFIIRDINGEKKHLVIDDLFHGYFFTVCPLSIGNRKQRVLTKTAKMTNGHSIHENKGFDPQTPENDENDENGGCHAHLRSFFAFRPCSCTPDKSPDSPYPAPLDYDCRAAAVHQQMCTLGRPFFT